MDPPAPQAYPSLFEPISTDLTRLGIEPASNPVQVLTALNAKLSSLLESLPPDYIDPIFPQDLSKEQEAQIEKLNKQFQEDYMNKHKVVLGNFDLLIAYMKSAPQVEKETAHKIQCQRQALHPFGKKYTIYDLHNARDFTILDPIYADEAVTISPFEPDAEKHGEEENVKPKKLNVKTAVFDLTPIPDGPKSRASKGKKKKQELKAKREAQPKRFVAKPEKPLSKTQQKRLARAEEAKKAQEQEETEETTTEKNVKTRKQKRMEKLQKKKQQNAEEDSESETGSSDEEEETESNEEENEQAAMKKFEKQQLKEQEKEKILSDDGEEKEEENEKKEEEK